MPAKLEKTVIGCIFCGQYFEVEPTLKTRRGQPLRRTNVCQVNGREVRYWHRLERKINPWSGKRRLITCLKIPTPIFCSFMGKDETCVKAHCLTCGEDQIFSAKPSGSHECSGCGCKIDYQVKFESRGNKRLCLYIFAIDLAESIARWKHYCATKSGWAS